MKKLFKTILLVAAAATLFASCQKEQGVTSEKETVKLMVHAKAENLSGDTKTYISDKQVLWGTGEYMTAALVSGEVLATYNSNSSSADACSGKSVATFEFDVELSASPVTYGGIYPASAVVGDNNTNATSFKVNLSAMQSATAASYDPSAYIMIAKPETFTEATSEWIASFRRTTALNKITLTGLEDNITSVKITVPEGKYLAGRRYMDLTTGEKGEVYSGGGRTNALTINYTTPLASDVESKDIWFTSWGVEIPEGAKVTIVAYSDNSSYTREITANSGGIKFNEGFLNTLTINMAADDVIVESIVDYSGNYLIVSTTHLLTDYNTSNYYNYVEAAGEELSDFWEIDGIENYVWTVSKLDDGSYSFYNAGTGKYLALTEDLNKAHEAENADENTARFIITEDNSALTIYSKAYPERKLRYNTSSPRFAFYSFNTGAIATLLEYTTDPRTPFDVVSGLTWDASGKTLSWTAAEGATNGYEYTKDNGETVTASETNSIDCSSWSNGNYSVKVRVVATEEKKTSDWSTACEFTISGGATTSILSFDFVTHPLGWPAAKADAAEGSYSYTLNNKTYTFTHSKEGDGIYCGGKSNTSGYLMVAKSNVLGLPAIDGCKLTKVVGTLNGSGSPSTKSEVSITDGTDVITGGASQTWNTKGGSYTYNLTNTEENTVYYLSVSSTANCQITTLELTYEKTSPLASINVSGTPTKTAYSVGEVFDTDGLVATATYANASTKDVTSSVEWTVTPETLSAGTTSVTVVAKYKGIQSNEYVVNGLSVKALSSITVKTAPTKVEYFKGEKFDPAGLVVYRNYSDETKDEYAYAGHESDFTFNPALTTALTTDINNVTITYQGKSVGQAITVKSIANTKETAYTVSEAKAIIDAGKDLTTQVYVKGIVSQVDSYYSTYKSITYWISEDGTTTNQFEVYSGKNLNNTDFSSKDDVKVGADVIVYGVIKKFNSTYEFDMNNYLVSYKVEDKPISNFIKTSNVLADKDVQLDITDYLNLPDAYTGNLNISVKSGVPANVNISSPNVTFIAGGDYTLTVTALAVAGVCAETSGEINFTVKDAVLQSVTIEGTLTKTSYSVGDTFDRTGLTLTANYSDGSHVDVTNDSNTSWKFDPETFTEVVTSVYVSADYKGVKANKSFDVTVTAAIKGLPVSFTGSTMSVNNGVGTATITNSKEGTAHNLQNMAASNNDYWLFTVPIQNLKSGDKVKIEFSGIKNNKEESKGTYTFYYYSSVSNSEKQFATYEETTTASKKDFTLTMDHNINDGTLYIKMKMTSGGATNAGNHYLGDVTISVAN